MFLIWSRRKELSKLIILYLTYKEKQPSHLLNCITNICDNQGFLKWYGSCEHHYLHFSVDTDLLPDFKLYLWTLLFAVQLNFFSSYGFYLLFTIFF